jgi:hypothetical protein
MEGYLGEKKVSVKKTIFAKYKPQDWALYFIFRYGQIDGAHHKQWVLDQVTRILNGAKVTVKKASWSNGDFEYRVTVGDSKKYLNWVEVYKDGGNYSYDEGIAP